MMIRRIKHRIIFYENYYIDIEDGSLFLKEIRSNFRQI